jgi:hypothetical protein
MLLPLLGIASLAQAEPRVQRPWDKRTRYGQSGTRVFVDGPSGGDVMQGRAGSCYLLAPLAGLAQARPAEVREMIRQRKDGEVAVRFFDGRMRRVVDVDQRVPRFKNGKALNAHSRDPREEWVPLVEKAYASLRRGGYERLTQGGYASDALAALTGHRVLSSPLAELSADSVFRRIVDARSHERVAVTSTFTSSAFRRRGKTYSHSGLWPGHEYTIWNAFVRDGERYVTVRDPYGFAGPRNTGAWAAGRGLRTMRLDRFMRLFEDLDVER